MINGCFSRHGESVWNVTDPARGLVTRFTGWANIELTQHGLRQAAAAGRCLRMFGIFPDAVYTSLLKRSQDTYLELAQPENANISNTPIINTWRLNERHYGSLMGLSKEEAEMTMGKELVRGWRRSWDLAPPKMLREDEHYWRNAPWAEPKTIISYPGKPSVISYEKGIPMPLTESLQDCAKRVQPVWEKSIAPRVARGDTVLVVAHANSIRSLIKHIDAETLSDEAVRNVHIPSATPLVYNFTLKDPSILHTDNIEFDANVAKLLKPLGEPSSLGMTGRYLASKETVRLALKTSAPAEDEAQGRENGQFLDLIDKGLTEIIDYVDNTQEGKREALIIADGRGQILHANKAWEALVGFQLQEVTGQTSKILQGPLTSEEELQKINEKLRTGLPATTKLINYRKDGTPFENNVTIIPIFDWIHENDDYSFLSGQQKTNHSNTSSSINANNDSFAANMARKTSGSFLDYGGSDNYDERKVFDKFIQPSYFVARLDSQRPLNEQEAAM